MHKKYKIKDSKFSKISCNKSNTTDAICGAETAYPSGTPDFTPGFSGVRVARSLFFCVMFFELLFFLIFWPWHCLSSYLRLLITPLVSSKFSYTEQ